MNSHRKIVSSPYLEKNSNQHSFKEKCIALFFSLNGIVASLLIILIFAFLAKESYNLLSQLDLSEFIYSKKIVDGNITKVYEWYPTSDTPRYSLLPLLTGSLLTALPATLISTLLGLLVGIYISEIAPPKFREFLKPLIELFAGIPTVVVGFFMLVVFATFFNDLFEPINRLNAFLAALGLSTIVIPIIASLTEDALRTIPDDIRMGSYALGATKWQTIRKVILPIATKGLSAGIILGFGRAIGETMIVLMASGNAAVITLDIFSSVRTISATIAAELGEVSHQSAHYFALFFIGIVLFVVTFSLNLLAEIIFAKMKKRVGR